jgi:hypothetical protein
MTLISVAALLALPLFLTGWGDESCIDCVDDCVDTSPPIPTGVFSVTGDEMVTLYWSPIWNDNIVEYVIYASETYEGPYYEIGSVAWDENFDDVLGIHWFNVAGLINGQTLFYAVTSVNADGFESDLSYEEIFDTPRPEGFDLELFDILAAPDLSGYDFSVMDPISGRLSPFPASMTSADIYVSFEENVPYVQVARPAHVLIQDYGSFLDGNGFVRLDWVDWAPSGGYSETGRAELIRGHAYIVMIQESASDVHFAKFAVTGIRSQSVVIDWAYQVANGSRELKSPSGAKSPPVNAELVRF